LLKKYNTNSPYQLCELLDIEVFKCELGTIKGYYHHAYRIKQIYLNSNLSRREEKLVLAHELGHAIMHPNSNTPFFKANTFTSIDKLEKQANTFAMHCLISDNDLYECSNYTVSQLSILFGYDEELISLRLS
jgi:Zn-dependent peptidase ImmA (M78 family)